MLRFRGVGVQAKVALLCQDQVLGPRAGRGAKGRVLGSRAGPGAKGRFWDQGQVGNLDT